MLSNKDLNEALEFAFSDVFGDIMQNVSVPMKLTGAQYSKLIELRNAYDKYAKNPGDYYAKSDLKSRLLVSVDSVVSEFISYYNKRTGCQHPMMKGRDFWRLIELKELKKDVDRDKGNYFATSNLKSALRTAPQAVSSEYIRWAEACDNNVTTSAHQNSDLLSAQLKLLKAKAELAQAQGNQEAVEIYIMAVKIINSLR